MSVGFTVTPGAESAYKAMIGCRLGDAWTPKPDKAEALRLEFQQYAHCLETGERPRTDGLAGLCVVRILEAATQSLEGRGKLVELKAQGAGA